MNLATHAARAKRALVAVLLVSAWGCGGANDPATAFDPTALPGPGNPGASTGGAGGHAGGVGTIGGLTPPPAPPPPAHDLQRVEALVQGQPARPARLFDLARQADGSVFLAAAASREKALLTRFQKSGQHRWTAVLQAVDSPAGGTCPGAAAWVEIVGVLLIEEADQGRVVVSGHYCGELQTHQGRTSALSQGVDAFVASYRLEDGGVNWFQTLSTQGADWISRPLWLLQGGSRGVGLAHAYSNEIQLEHIDERGMWSQAADPTLNAAFKCSGGWTGLVAGASPDGARLGVVAQCDATPRVACLSPGVGGASLPLLVDGKQAQDIRVRTLLVADKKAAGAGGPCVVMAGEYEWTNVSDGGVGIDRERGAFVRAFNSAPLENWSDWIPGDAVANDLAWWRDGRIVVGGWFRGALSLQHGPRPWVSSGTGDGFVAALDADNGKATWSTALAGSGGSWDLQLGNGGRELLAGGVFSQQITHGRFMQHSTGRDLFLARFPVP